MTYRNRIKDYTEAPISRHMILDVLQDYQRPNDKISELIKRQELIALRRGLYIAGPSLDTVSPEPFLIANHLRGPSYVSLESAMAYWDMIPEKVVEISSVTTKSSKTYKTDVGRYSYRHLKAPFFAYGIKYVKFTARQSVLLAAPEKALCDKIILTPNINLRSIKQTKEFLLDDLRIEEDLLAKLDTNKILSWLEYAPKKKSLLTLIKTLKAL